MKSINIDDICYMFETMEQLVEMLKGEGYEVSLDIKKKGKIRGNKVIL